MTRAQAIPTMRDDDTALITALQRQLREQERKFSEVTTDRDELLRVLAIITAALGLPEGIDPHKVIMRIQELV